MDATSVIVIYCTYDVKQPSLTSANYLGGHQVGSFVLSEPCVIAWTGGHNVFVFGVSDPLVILVSECCMLWKQREGENASK